MIFSSSFELNHEDVCRNALAWVSVDDTLSDVEYLGTCEYLIAKSLNTDIDLGELTKEEAEDVLDTMFVNIKKHLHNGK